MSPSRLMAGMNADGGAGVRRAALMAVTFDKQRGDGHLFCMRAFAIEQAMAAGAYLYTFSRGRFTFGEIGLCTGAGDAAAPAAISRRRA